MTQDARKSDVVMTEGPGGPSPVLLLCEHASRRLPPEFGDLGLSADVRSSHVAWDPGALNLARHLAVALDAPLVAGGVSRLLYDCNRPPDAPGAVPARSETSEATVAEILTGVPAVPFGAPAVEAWKQTRLGSCATEASMRAPTTRLAASTRSCGVRGAKVRRSGTLSSRVQFS